jgi:hypothetical protein
MKKMLPVAFLATCFAASVAFAQLPAFEDVDLNGDGVIDREEAALVEGLDFDLADANDDGVIDRDEWEAMGGE